jgi:metal-responsive CopG/Arc/MetJ family transcriptional regulator
MASEDLALKLCSMKKNSNQRNYVTLQVPKALADEIDRFIESGTLGYRSRAEMVNDFIRQGIEKLTLENSGSHSNFKQNRKQ